MKTINVTKTNKQLARQVLKQLAKSDKYPNYRTIIGSYFSNPALGYAIGYCLRETNSFDLTSLDYIASQINDNVDPCMKGYDYPLIDIDWLLDMQEKGKLTAYAKSKQDWKPSKGKGKKRKAKANKGKVGGHPFNKQEIIKDDPIINQQEEATPMKPENNEQQQVAEQIAEILVNANKPAVDEDRIIELIKEHGAQARPVIVKTPDLPEREDVDVGMVHGCFDEALNWINMGFDLYFSGETGSGKSTTARKIAEALDKPFFCIGAIMSKFETMGQMMPEIGYIESEVRRWIDSDGGLLCIDEIDASNPNALTTVMSLFDQNGNMVFTDGSKVERTPEHRVIITGNTIGTGANADYNSRMKLDNAFLTRFIRIAHEYDAELENYLGGQKIAGYARKFREALKAKKFHGSIISPRAIIQASSVYNNESLSQGMKDNMIKSVFKQGLSDEDYTAIINDIGALA